MDIALLLLVALGSLAVGGGIGWLLCTRYIPTFMAKLSDSQMKALASKVADRRQT